MPTVQKASSALNQLKMSPWWTFLHTLVIRVVSWVHVEMDPRITVTSTVRIYVGINRVIVYLAGRSQRTEVLTDKESPSQSSRKI